MAVRLAVGLVALSVMVAAQAGAAHAADDEEKKLRLVSEQTVSGFTFPESVAYDPKAKVSVREPVRRHGVEARGEGR